MTYSVTSQQRGQTKLQGLEKRKLYAAIAGGLLLAVIGGAALKLTMATSGGAADDAPAASLAPAETDGEALSEPLIPATGDAATPFQTQPFLAASGPLRLADPSLLRSTSPQARVEAIATGRPDPFAAVVLPGPSLPRASSAAIVLTPAPPAIAGQALPPIPVAATQGIPSVPQGMIQPVALPTLPAPFLPGTTLPAAPDVAIAPTNGAASQNLVDQVVISGVVQVSSSVNVIVTEPGSSVSRRVSQGDMLAGGRIKVKSVDMSGQEPVVVLTYDGRDYTRTVGAALASAL